MRRANGTGNIVDLGANRRNRYAVRVSYQERPGLWKQRYISYHRTAREAQESLEAYLRGGVSAHTLGVTLGDIYDGWSARKYARAGAASIASYKASWTRLSVLKDREMSRISIDDLQEIIDRDEANGLSRSSISNDKTLMNALYRHAMERDIVGKDCSAFLELPSVPPKMEKGAFTETQINLLAEMTAGGFPWADTVLMLCYTGFRVSEFLGLTPESYCPEEDYLRGGMKTAAGKNRIVPVHQRIRPCLEEWLERGGETIICDESGHSISAAHYRALFSTVMKELGVPDATPHWCRHTAASRMKMAGVDDLAARRILGHSDRNITEHYTHVEVAFLREEMRKVP